MQQHEHAPVAQVDILVRRPRSEVFSAFVDPAKITQFWLSKASGPLQAGRRVHWDFMVRGASADIEVRALDADERIVITFDDGSTVEWRFTDFAGDVTRVVVTQSGFTGSGDEIITQALDATGGFTIVMCELKAYLERGESVGLVKDKALLIEERLSHGASSASD